MYSEAVYVGMGATALLTGASIALHLLSSTMLATWLSGAAAGLAFAFGYGTLFLIRSL